MIGLLILVRIAGLTAIAGLRILRERLGLRTIIGLVVATSGVVIVAGSGLGLDLGVVLCLIGLTSYAVYTVLLRGEPSPLKQLTASRGHQQLSESIR